jgi:tRNA nucleotidyltransferase (CCA-adding enzyme)
MDIEINVPKDVQNIIEKLEEKGFSAYIVGGCVRDAVMGKKPHDYDICTSALPEEVHEIFKERNIIDTGLQHGTVTVGGKDDYYEITTYRIDGEYSDNRRPSEVKFVDNIKLDLARRDFTMNAMAYNQKTGLYDPFGGLSDIENKTIKCVGEPDERFKEDALRIMRAVRFASVCGFKIDYDTKVAMFNNKKLLNNVSEERKNVEFCKMLVNADFDLLNNYKDIFATFIPELKETFYFNQNNYHHKYDVYEHMMHAVANAPKELTTRLALFFHDIGKPASYTEDEKGVGHFFGHANVSENITRRVMSRMKFDNSTINNVCELVKYHDLEINGSLKSARKLLNKMSLAQAERLISVQTCDKKAQTVNPHSKETLKNIELLRKNLEIVINEKQCFSLRDLAINGNDLKSIGFKEGKEIGLMLNQLLDVVLEDPSKNNKEILTQLVFELKNKNINNTIER